MKTDKVFSIACAATKEAARWLYRTTYVGGAETISCREPTAHTKALTWLRTWDYAKAASVPVATARKRLRELAAEGCIVEHKARRVGGVVQFRLPDAENERIGREIIAELVAEGLPFDDAWRASRKESA